jgi:hypothetical protein
VPRLHDLDRVRLERIEECWRVDGCVYDGTSWWVRRRLDVWVKEPQGWRRLGGKDGEESEKLWRIVVWEVGQRETLCVVLVYPVTISVPLLLEVRAIMRAFNPGSLSGNGTQRSIHIPEPPDQPLNGLLRRLE